MPSFRVSGGVEGAAGTLLEHIQNRRERQEKEEDDLRKFRLELQQSVLTTSDPGKYTDEFTQAILSGQPIQGVQPFNKGYISKADLALQREDRRISQQRYSNSAQINQRLLADQIVKDYRLIDTQVRSLDSLAESARANPKQNMVGLQQGLITVFNKVTDPRSVVRESEYERTPANLSLANRFEGAYKKLLRGGAGLTQEDIDSLVFAAKLIGDQYGESYNSIYGNYESQASNPDYELDPKIALGGLKRHTSYFAQPTTFNTEDEALNSGLPSGTVVVVGGKRFRLE